MSRTRRPYIPYKPQPTAFLPANRFAMDPIFNIVLTKHSAHDPSDRGNTRPAMKTVVWYATGISTTPDLRRGEIRFMCDQYPIAARRDRVDPLVASSNPPPLTALLTAIFTHVCIRLMLLFISCIWTFLLSPVQSLPIILTNP